MSELERTPDGDINNRSLANLAEESECQMCGGICLDPRGVKTMIDQWLAHRNQWSLDKHVRPEIQALAERGNVTPAEVAELRCNSWEWEHLIPAMNDEAFVARVEHAIKNCSPREYPCRSYDDAVYGLYAPELLRRFVARQRPNEPFNRGFDEAIAWAISILNDGASANVARAALQRLIPKDGQDFRPCFSCMIEADIGTMEEPHSVPARYHTCRRS